MARKKNPAPGHGSGAENDRRAARPIGFRYAPRVETEKARFWLRLSPEGAEQRSEGVPSNLDNAVLVKVIDTPKHGTVEETITPDEVFPPPGEGWRIYRLEVHRTFWRRPARTVEQEAGDE
jgi:hypothetical protein